MKTRVCVAQPGDKRVDIGFFRQVGKADTDGAIDFFRGKAAGGQHVAALALGAGRTGGDIDAAVGKDAQNHFAAASGQTEADNMRHAAGKVDFRGEGRSCQLLLKRCAQLDQARGINKALERMVRDMIEKTKDCEHKILAISHCNCPERAKAVKEKIEKLVKFKDIIIVNTAGVSSMYANDGGVIMAV